MYKQLFNETSGRALNVAFEKGVTDRKIFLWVKDNLEELDLGLNESWSCKVSFDADNRTIQISGDEDLTFLNISNLELIKL